MNKTLTTLAAATAAFAFACAAPHAAAGGAAMGAIIEQTQILNHIQLVAQYQKQVQQAVTQLHSYAALEQQLKGLPASVRQQITGAGDSVRNGNLPSLAATQQMLGVLQSTQNALPVIQSANEHAYQTVHILNAEGHHVTYGQYETAMATLAQQRADTYGKQYAAYRAANTQVRQNMQKMSAIAASAPAIKSEVGGMQSLLQSNALLGQQLAGIHATLLKTAAVTTQQAQAQAQTKADKARHAESARTTNLIVRGITGMTLGPTKDSKH